MKQKLLEKLVALRGDDVYPDEVIKTQLIDTFFPSDINELTLNLSNVTSAFYGLTLKNIGEKIGFFNINKISENVFYDLGKLKTIECKSKILDFPKDMRSFVLVVISAIYNASPEYTFEIIKYSSSETILKLEGIDRYLRVLLDLKIDNYINFPVLVPFMNGIKDEIGLKCNIQFESNIDKNNVTTSTIYKFILNDN